MMFIDWEVTLRSLPGEWSVLCAGKQKWSYENSSVTRHRFNDCDEALQFYKEYLAKRNQEDIEAKRDPIYHSKTQEHMAQLCLDSQVIYEYNPGLINLARVSRWNVVAPPIKWAKDAPPTKVWAVTGRRP